MLSTAKWKVPVCKTGAERYVGSNPTGSTKIYSDVADREATASKPVTMRVRISPSEPNYISGMMTVAVRQVHILY